MNSLETLSFNMPTEAGVRGVIVTDLEHKVRFADPRISELLGIGASELIGRNIGSVVADNLKHRFKDSDGYERHSSWLRDNPGETAEDVMELLVPKHRILHRYSTPLLDENHQLSGRVEVYSDISKRRHLEETNATLYKQICAAYEELKATQNQLLQSEKLRSVGEIAGGVAHDFNNTLSIILGNIQLLLATATDEKVLTRLCAVEQAALDAAETVRRIREFTKILPDEPLNPVDLSELVRSVSNVMQPSWESAMHARDCSIELDLDLESGVYTSGVAHEIREVLANVLLNAVQAMPEGGSVQISTGLSDDWAWVKVSDSGVGMEEEVRNRVFDPFFTTKGVEGTGLGMSVAYGIIKRHNGRISIESRPGEGTKVLIQLPAALQEAVPEAAKEPSSSRSVTPARIIVVDDEERFAEVFEDMLSEHGHVVCVARSGSEAIEKFQANQFDLVFTDLGMPGMSGWQVARSIKELQPEMPVVLLTGWGARVDEEKLSESDIDMVLSKPVKLEDLSNIVSQAISGKGRNIRGN